MRTIKRESNGREFEFNIYEYLNDILVEVRVDGKRHTTAKPEVHHEMLQGKQHYGRIGKVYISKPDVWQEIWTAYTEEKERLESSDKYKVKKLREQREKLAYDLKYAREDLYETEQRKVEAMMQGDAYNYDADALNAAIADAEAALKAFDEAHPEIIVGIRKERDERTERNMWN